MRDKEEDYPPLSSPLISRKMPREITLAHTGVEKAHYDLYIEENLADFTIDELTILGKKWHKNVYDVIHS